MATRIPKSDSSEVFDLYIENMLKKRAGNPLAEVGEAAVKGLFGAGDEAAEVGAKVAPEVVETGAKVAPEAAGAGADVAKGVAKVTSEQLVDASRKAKVLSAQLDEMSIAADAASKGRAVPSRYAGWDKRKFLDELSKARKQLKGAKDQVKALKEAGDLTARELQQAGLVIAKSQAELDDAAAAILKLEQELAEAQQGAAKLTGELVGAEKMVAKLEEQIGTLTARNQDLVAEHAKAAEELGGLKALLNAAEEAGQAGSLEYKVVSESAEAAGKGLDESTKAVQQVAPKASEDVLKATQEIVAESEKRMASQLDEAVKAAKAGKETGQAAKAGEGIWSTFAKAAGKPAGEAFGKVLITGASIAFLIALTAGAVWYFIGSDETLREEAVRLTDALLAAIVDATNKTKPLKFNSNSTGANYQAGILGSLNESRAAVPEMKNNPEPERMQEIGALLDELSLDVDAFLRDQSTLQGDLANPAGFDSAIESLVVLKGLLADFKEFIYRATKQWEQSGQGTIAAPGPAAKEKEEGEASPSYTDTVYGIELDMSHIGPEIRSAGPRIIRKVMEHPVGMAFSDPHNRWGGGYLQNTGDPKVDLLQDLKFLVLNGISSPGELRRFMRAKMPRDSVRRRSGWKEAQKYYRDNRNRVNRGKSARKSANNNFSDEFSINLEGTLMKKQADSFSDSYYQDAVKGLAEQFAKSYYAGLKSMYEEKVGSVDEAEFDKMYQTLDETGAELVGRAHPQSANLVDSMGRGGLVENGLEQQRHNVEVALSTPSGNFRSRHASVMSELVKLANQADEAGKFEASDLIDKTIETIEKLT